MTQPVLHNSDCVSGLQQMHTCALNVLQATGDVRKVALWLGHESIQTTEDYLRVDVTERIGLLNAATPPQLKPGRYRPPDKLIAALRG